MSNLFIRIKNTITADLNEVLEQKEKQNPISLLNQYLRQCEQETEKVAKFLDRQTALKDEFTKELHNADQLAEKRKNQAEIASKAGETELYQFALDEQEIYANRADKIRASLEQVKGQLDELERKHGEMKNKLKDMQLRRMELMGRENVTRANHRMDQVLESNTDRSFSRFQEIENYINRLENQVNRSYNQTTIDARIEQLEREMNH
ncbi:PspA/IM30 family protein [Neobacillus sp. 179-C4.2 HS]|uniref:PspA/IM30 family protein n=1 Tax=Neobacillus driksii TaxID=3035913 RepID=A0ABV4YW78_9BACI|nr:PspA/IM30 family protein [Neobacillus sp. 179.-C4.2 HS]MDP5192234.1 PspA/IM30 family protein [Neobacillus sp. 179.-C4.2 HS]